MRRAFHGDLLDVRTCRRTEHDLAGNIYFTSCECGYGQVTPNPRGSLWMLVAADQIPEGAEVAPVGQQQAGSEQEESEEIAGATPAP